MLFMPRARIRQHNVRVKPPGKVQTKPNYIDHYFTGDKCSKVLEWLCPTEMKSRHADVQAERTAGTGKWLLECPKFRLWEQGKGASRLLWGCGIPGAGKTFLRLDIDLSLTVADENLIVAVLR
jgi:hypothetical protein